MAWDIALDVRVKRNRNLFFYPAQGVLATELRSSEIRGEGGSHLNAIGGTIPGHRIEIDTKAKKVRVVDRLKLPENSELLERINEYMRSSDYFLHSGLAPDFRRDGCVREFERKLSNTPPDNLATWLYHARKLVDMGKLHLVRGQLPTLEEIERNADGDIILGDRIGLTAINNDPDFDRIKVNQKASKKQAANA